MAMNKKQKKELIIGGVVVAAGIAYYMYSKSQSTTTPVASSTASTPATTPIASIPASTTAPAAPTVLPVSPTTIDFIINSVNADNQDGYLVDFSMSIENNTGGPVQVTQVSGNCSMDVVTQRYFESGHWPMQPTGLLGSVNDTTITTIPVGMTFTKAYSVTVPVNASTNIYIANLVYALATAVKFGSGGFGFYFTGQAMIANVSVPFKAVYAFASNS